LGTFFSDCVLCVFYATPNFFEQRYTDVWTSFTLLDKCYIKFTLQQRKNLIHGVRAAAAETVAALAAAETSASTVAATIASAFSPRRRQALAAYYEFV